MRASRINILPLNFVIILGTIMLLASVLRLHGIMDLPLSADELQVLSSAANYMERGHFGLTMWQHPKLRNILVYWCQMICGGNVWGVRGVSLLFGILSVPFVGLMGRRMTGSALAGLLAAFFLAVDPLHIDFSRQAVQEVYMPFFFLPAIYFGLVYRDKRNPLFLAVTGVLFGLGIASKWYVAFPLCVVFGLLVRDTLIASEGRVDGRFKELFALVVSLILLPLSVYLLSYLPWFLHRGYDLGDWFVMQKLMLHETVLHSGFSSYDMELDHKPLLWFLKPVAYADFVMGSRPHILLTISNPFVWLATLPAVGYTGLRWWKKRSVGDALLILLFLSSYMPLAFARRPIWLHTAFAVIPFAFIAVGSAVADLSADVRHGTKILIVYLLLVTATAFPLYLLATGRGEQIGALRPLIYLYRPSNER